MSSISEILVSNVAPGAVAGLRYRLLGLYVSTRNSADTAATFQIVRVVVGGVDRDFTVLITPNVVNYQNVSFPLPPGGFLTDINTGIVFGSDFAPAFTMTTIIYQTVVD